MFYQNMLMRMLSLELAARGVKDPLRQYFRYADIWAELARLTQEPLPADVAAIVNEPPFSGWEEQRDAEKGE